ncbi:MAG: serine--tRNA ligase [Actinomycetota bacterium]|nr:serine--tRNA ligase [Actinomycetota bacterium]|tara:strand:- start:1358 stop:2608 length:1251 start_codon:yes stop_codon:yes gene_type:complete
MIDPNILKDNREILEENIKRRKLDVSLEELITLDELRRKAKNEADEIRSKQKKLSKEIPSLKGAKKEEALEEAGALSNSVKELTKKADDAEKNFYEKWVKIPNIVDKTSPDGSSEDDNKELRIIGDIPSITKPKNHLELGENLGIIDVEQAANVSGSRFSYLLGDAVLIEFNLVNWVISLLNNKGFTPVVPPVLVRENALYGTGFFPDDAEQVYSIPNDDLYLVGTSEVSLAAYHAESILEDDKLPLRYAGFSTCFRRESGTYGKDTSGIFRVHQFDKVEMFSFCSTEKSREEHEFLLSIEEEIMQALEIPYRVVDVCAGDLGASATKKYDIEAWIPSQQKYREVTSCSNTTDYQSRRLNIRTKKDKKSTFIHTLNGTALAVGRVLIALLENNQNEDGTVSFNDSVASIVGLEKLS